MTAIHSKDEAAANTSRARRLLIEALRRSEIPERDLGPNYQPVYWHSSKIGESDVIQVSITTHVWGSGYCTLILYPEGLAERITGVISDDEEVTRSLIDALAYIKFTVAQLLGRTTQLLSLRSLNEYCRRYPNEHVEAMRGADSILGSPIRRAFEKARKDMENQLALEPIAKRGGSDPKLPPDERDSLHVLYDGMHKVTKHIKSDYNATFKKFTKVNRKQGYSRAQWKAYWKKYSEAGYPPDLHEMLPLFAEDGDPSAADVAYTFIAKTKGHKKSYLPKLIRESRQKARTLKQKK